jgi:S1-C subfamily serine protease
MPHLAALLSLIAGCVLGFSTPSRANFWDPLPGHDNLIQAARSGYPEAQIELARVYIRQRTPNARANAAALLHLARSGGARILDREINDLARGLDRRSLIQAHNAAVILYTRYNHPTLEIDEPAATPTTSDPQSPPEPELLGNGSGTVISDEGLVLTAAHVLPDSADIQFRSGNATFPAEIVAIDRKTDLALLKIEPGKLPAAPLRLDSTLKLGTPVFTIGFPNIKHQGVSPKLNKGEISSLAGYRDDPSTWQISVPVLPGNSGGALFDNEGHILGVVVSKLFLQGAGHVGYAVTSAKLAEFLRDHPAIKTIKETITLVSFEEVADRAAQSCGLVLSYKSKNPSTKP